MEIATYNVDRAVMIISTELSIATVVFEFVLTTVRHALV